MRNKYFGIASVSFLLVVFGAILLFWQAVKLAPVYLENFRVVETLESLQSEPGLAKLSRIKVLDLVLERLASAKVKSVTEDDLVLSHSLEKTSLEVVYSAKVRFISNIDFVVHFSEHIEIVH